MAAAPSPALTPGGIPAVGNAGLGRTPSADLPCPSLYDGGWGGGAPSTPRGPLPIPSAERSAGRCGDEAAQPRRSIQEPPRPPLAGGRLSRSLRGRLGSADGIAANIFYFFNFFACLPFAIFHPLSSEIAAGALSFNPAAAAAPDRAEQTAESSPTRRHFVPIPQRQRPPMCPPLLGCGDVALSAPPPGWAVQGMGFASRRFGGARGRSAPPAASSDASAAFPLRAERRGRALAAEAPRGGFGTAPPPRPPGCPVPFDLASGSIQRQEEKMPLCGQSVF